MDLVIRYKDEAGHIYRRLTVRGRNKDEIRKTNRTKNQSAYRL